MSRAGPVIRLALAAALAAATLAAAAQQNPVATVNGVAIPGALGEFMLRQQAAKNPGADAARLRESIRDDLVNREVIVQEARRSGLLKRPDIDTELELLQQSTIVRLYLREWVRAHPVSEADLRKGYEQLKAGAPETEYRARHILLETEREAREVIDALKAGQKFEALARRSRDPGTRGRGGELGWSVPGAFDGDFARAVTALRKGQRTEAPVRTRFGFHVIELLDTRPVTLPGYEQVKPRIMQQLTQRRIEAMVRELRARATVQ